MGVFFIFNPLTMGVLLISVATKAGIGNADLSCLLTMGVLLIVELKCIHRVGICNCHLGQRTQSKSTLCAIVLDGFCLESFRASYSFSTAKKSNQKMPLATKVLNRTKMAYSWVVPNVSLQPPLK
jgi:hypothetical protein